jgi:hypothetical protein
MHDTLMTLEEFETQLDRHGADPARWPASATDRAQRLLAQSDAARALLAEARDISALLDDALPAATLTTNAVRTRILGLVQSEAERAGVFARLLNGLRWRRPIAIAAASIPLLVGYAIGIGYQPGGFNEDLASDVSLLAFADYENYIDAN